MWKEPMIPNWMDLKLHQLLSQIRELDQDPVGTKLDIMQALQLEDLVTVVIIKEMAVKEATAKEMEAVVVATIKEVAVMEATTIIKEEAVMVTTTMETMMVVSGLECTPITVPSQIMVAVEVLVEIVDGMAKEEDLVAVDLVMVEAEEMVAVEDLVEEEED